MFADDTLREEIIASQYVHRSSKAEIVQYYQQEYPGKEGRNIAWKKHLIGDILADRGITPENTHPKEYKRQAKNVGKRFEAQRLRTPEPKNKADYEDLGKKLPPVPPKEANYTVRVYGEIRISSFCKAVDFKITVSSSYQDTGFSLLGSNAENFTDNPNVYDLVMAYFDGDPGYDGWCDGPYFEIM